MPYADPVKQNEYFAKYREEHREKAKQYSKNYYENNNEKAKDYAINYRILNKDLCDEYRILNRRKIRIKSWKKQGIKAEDFEEVYDYYIMSNNCEYCWKELREGRGSGNAKHLDHNHTTGEIRGILCGYCNLNDVFKNC